MDGIRVAREMSETCDTIVAVGGDGTVYEVLNGAIDKDITYGILPFGSGNDISRSLHVFEKTDEGLADMIMNPKPREFDTGLYELFPAFIFAIIANVAVSVMTGGPEPEVEQEFKEYQAALNQ